jgi:hypothetical protein
VNFAAITLCVAPQRVFSFVVVHFVIDSVRKLLDIPSYIALVTRTLRLSSSIHWTPGTLSPGVKWPEREADHSPPLTHTSSWRGA